ncbi:phosphopantetheine-binding protein [Streptomyces avermitilis]|uniref:phosphopantetheine-binding protein n=1 Tax=Streptomyces avermitilis TaxID=33903 RepID=UPI003F4B23D4
MAEEGIDRIDLLRVDAEHAAYDVLLGVADSDWHKIRQLVVQLHDVDGALKKSVALLKKHGFDVVSEQVVSDQDDRPSHGTPLHTVYARRPADTAAGSAPPRAVPVPRWPNERVLREELDAALRAALPPYMVPSGYVVLDELPLTGNGKLDTRALPEPEIPVRPDDHATAPRTEAERIVSEVWAELLHTDAGLLGPDSDFFVFGGNSLLVTRMINLIKQRTGVELQVQTVFDAHRLADLAAVVARGIPDTGSASALDLDTISESISLVESMTDAELDALDMDNAVPGIES